MNQEELLETLSKEVKEELIKYQTINKKFPDRNTYNNLVLKSLNVLEKRFKLERPNDLVYLTTIITFLRSQIKKAKVNNLW